MNSTLSFSELGVPANLVSGLTKLQITVPTPIQVAAIPAVLAGHDSYLQAETGTGKTLAYLLPLFSKLDTKLAATQTIILAPTYELAIQIQRQCTDLAQHSGLPVRALLLIGGTSRDRQIEKLKKKPQIVIGSSGRILELIKDGKLKVKQITSVVVDEADRLLADESLELVISIIESTPEKRQLIFASATQYWESGHAISTLAPNLKMVTCSETLVNPNIEHIYLNCEERDKPDLLRSLLASLQPERAIVFVHKNETAEIVASKLAHHKVRVADLHGEYDKLERQRAMNDFRSGKINVLIASDVAARGLDIKDVTHIFNLDVPTESNAYLHRVGRTGRAGASGIAVSLIAGPQARLIRRWEIDLGIKMKEVYLRNGQVHLAQGPSEPS